MSAALIARESWTRTPRPVDKLAPLVAADVRGIAVHWPGSTGGSWADPTLAQSAARLESERRQHTSPASNDPTKPWSDIAYSLAVDLAGRLFDCRGIAYRPAANGDRVVNERYVAVTVLMGPGDVVTSAAVNGVRAARALVLARYPHAIAVVGHRDLHPTTCPGDALYGGVRSGTFTAAGGGPAPMEEPMAAVDLTPAALDAASAEVWGAQSSFVVHLPADLDPVKYAERRLDNPAKTPVISPITALNWTMQSARSGDAAAHAALVELAAVRQDIATLRQDFAALRAELAAAGKTALDPAAIAHAVRAEFSAHPLT